MEPPWPCGPMSALQLRAAELQCNRADWRVTGKRLLGRRLRRVPPGAEHPSAFHLSCALDPRNHRVERQPDIPDLTVVLGGLGFGEHPVGQ